MIRPDYFVGMKVIYAVRLICTRNYASLSNIVNWSNKHSNRLFVPWTLCVNAKRGLLQPSKFNSLKKWHRKDKRSAEYELIYKIPFDWFFKVIGVVAAVTLSISVIVVIEDIGYRTGYLVRKKPLEHFLVIANVRHSENGALFFGTILFMLNAIFLRFIGRTPLRMYRKIGLREYVAVYQRYCLPWSVMTYNFKTATKHTSLLSVWKQCAYKLDGRVNVLLIENFKTPSELHQMMGGSGTDVFETVNSDSKFQVIISIYCAVYLFIYLF